jgi:hypothetical protein
MNNLRLLVAGLVLGLGALAAHALDARFDAPPPEAIAIGEITLGSRLAAKVNEYGERDVAQLVDILRNDLERELGRIGRLAEPSAAGAVLDVVIEDANPNRPTPQQQSALPRALDARSVFRGGARLSATLTARDETLGRFAYAYQTTPDIRASEFATTWTDARRTFDRFATRMADAIESEGRPGS